MTGTRPKSPEPRPAEKIASKNQPESGKRPRKPEKPEFCQNPVYVGMDLIDDLAGDAQLLALGGGAIGQTEQYPAMRAAARAGALRAYAAFGAVRDLVTVGKFFLGDRTTVGDLAKTLAVKGLGLDKAREVLADTFGNLVERAREVKKPCS